MGNLHQKCPTVPPLPKVFLPNLTGFGNLSAKHSKPSCSSYMFQKDNQEVCNNCFSKTFNIQDLLECECICVCERGGGQNLVNLNCFSIKRLDFG